MGVTDQPPPIPLDVRVQLEGHRLKVENCQLRFKVAELQLMVADRDAALESVALTQERERLAALVNTAEWTYDFDRGEYRQRAPAVPAPPEPVHVEARWTQSGVVYDRTDVPLGASVQVRVRYPAEVEVDEGQIRAQFPQAVRVSVARVPVADMER